MQQRLIVDKRKKKERKARMGQPAAQKKSPGKAFSEGARSAGAANPIVKAKMLFSAEVRVESSGRETNEEEGSSETVVQKKNYGNRIESAKCLIRNRHKIQCGRHRFTKKNLLQEKTLAQRCLAGIQKTRAVRGNLFFGK